MSAGLHLVLGGVRSGKSAVAERLAGESGLAVTCIATADAGDASMAERIRRHQKRRPSSWGLVEEPLRLAQAALDHSRTDLCLLIEDLNLWLANLSQLGEREYRKERDRLLEALPNLEGRAIIVSAECGSGMVPANAAARLHLDRLGELNQRVAALADRVSLVVAGRMLKL